MSFTMSSGAWTLDDVSTQRVAFTRVWGTAQGSVWLGGNSLYLEDPDNIYSSKPAAALCRRMAASPTFAPVDLPPDPVSGSLAASLDAANASSATSIWVFGRLNFGYGTWLGTSTDDGLTFSWTFQPRPIDYALSAVWGKSRPTCGSPALMVVSATGMDPRGNKQRSA